MKKTKSKKNREVTLYYIIVDDEHILLNTSEYAELDYLEIAFKEPEKLVHLYN